MLIKINYLKGLLKGEAYRLINGLSLSNRSYETAVDLLQKRFGDMEKLRTTFMEALMKLQVTTSDVKKLRYFYDTLERHIRNLESLDVSATTYGILLTPQLMRKLPEEIRRIIIRCCDGDAVNIDTFRKYLQNEIET